MSVGVISYANELNKRCEDKTGMDYVYAKYEALNYSYCWGFHPLWGMVNRHLWRLNALYEGGDCFLAGWHSTQPHDALWTLDHSFDGKYGNFRKAYLNTDLLAEESRALHARRHKNLLQKSPIESIKVRANIHGG